MKKVFFSFSLLCLLFLGVNAQAQCPDILTIEGYAAGCDLTDSPTLIAAWNEGGNATYTFTLTGVPGTVVIDGDNLYSNGLHKIFFHIEFGDITVPFARGTLQLEVTENGCTDTYLKPVGVRNCN